MSRADAVVRPEATESILIPASSRTFDSRDPDDLLMHVNPLDARMDNIHRHLPAGPDNGHRHAARGARDKIEIL